MADQSWFPRYTQVYHHILIIKIYQQIHIFQHLRRAGGVIAVWVITALSTSAESTASARRIGYHRPHRRRLWQQVIHQQSAGGTQWSLSPAKFRNEQNSPRTLYFVIKLDEAIFKTDNISQHRRKGLE